MTRFGDRTPLPRSTVYTKPGCVQCRATLRALQRKELTFVTIDITTDPQARDFNMSLGVSAGTGGGRRIPSLEWLPPRPHRRPSPTAPPDVPADHPWSSP
jgi:glutaredoxin